MIYFAIVGVGLGGLIFMSGLTNAFIRIDKKREEEGKEKTGLIEFAVCIFLLVYYSWSINYLLRLGG